MAVDPRREGKGRGPRTTTPATDPDTGAGHRPARAQPTERRERDGLGDAPPAAEPNERNRPPIPGEPAPPQ
jgi:hypothetical protein